MQGRSSKARRSVLSPTGLWMPSCLQSSWESREGASACRVGQGRNQL
ncbi:unnamed protein product [Gulo gulo]|uniref:Uncharacterized protein n=1 Tax=Gulo gulo TaxID=48420 RepID=A0A9X9LKG6_GULGU|nr:unnamed protein product [Gulo gulo]